MAKLLIRNIDWILTVDRDRRLVRDGSIATEGERIVYVGPAAGLPAGFAADETIDGRGLVATPGLIDTSCATVLQIGRGAGDGCDVPRFRFERSLACEGALDAADARAASLACQLEMLRAGTTTFADAGSRFPVEVADAAVQSGLRAVVPRSLADVFDTFTGPFPDSVARESAADALRAAGDALSALEKRHPRVMAGMAIPWLGACSDALLGDAAALARERGARLLITAGFARDDAVASRREFGRTETARLAEAGLLGPGTLVAHAGWTGPRDLRTIADSGASVACCPAASHRQGTGSLEFGRFPELMAFGVNVALGSGSPMAGNHADIARQLFLYSGGSMSLRLDATCATAETALEMATINGARALGLDGLTGSLEAGKKADIALFNARAEDWMPLINPVGNLVYSSRGGAHTVVVDGAVLLSENRLRNLDEAQILDEIQARADGLIQRAGMGRFCRPAWPVE